MITVSETVDAPRERLWQIITDYRRWADVITGIRSVEVIEAPQKGIVGLRWRETREMFGKEATETMWVSDAEPGHWYEVTADNHGMHYTTRLSLAELNGKTTITMQFDARPVTFVARLMSLVSFMFSGTVRKMLAEDIADIRRAAETA